MVKMVAARLALVYAVTFLGGAGCVLFYPL